jgi:hypothetical protein
MYFAFPPSDIAKFQSAKLAISHTCRCCQNEQRSITLTNWIGGMDGVD